jgi:hypothetical protein
MDQNLQFPWRKIIQGRKHALVQDHNKKTPSAEAPRAEVNLKPILRPPRRCAEDQTTDNSLERRVEGIHHEIGHFGDHLRRKPQKTIRLLLQNVGGIGFCSQLRHIETLKMEKNEETCVLIKT